MKTNATIEELAQKMNQSVWSKGNLKRIYLNDAGWNTKKMRTKTFIWQDENGEFKVSCRIDCPSQPYQWIDSQEQQIKDSVSNNIERVLSKTVYIMVNENQEIVDWQNQPVDLVNCTYYFTESEAKYEIGNCNYESYITMSRDDFDAEVEKLEMSNND